MFFLRLKNDKDVNIGPYETKEQAQEILNRYNCREAYSIIELMDSSSMPKPMVVDGYLNDSASHDLRYMLKGNCDLPSDDEVARFAEEALVSHLDDDDDVFSEEAKNKLFDYIVNYIDLSDMEEVIRKAADSAVKLALIKLRKGE